MKCQPKANNNRKAVVVCAKHVVKRPCKRMRPSIYIYVCINMFICSELIEETGRPPGLILVCGDIFGLARISSIFGNSFTHLMCILILQIGWPPQISNMLTHHRFNRDGTKFEKKIDNFQNFFIYVAQSAV